VSRRIANLPPLGSALVPVAERMREITAQLPVRQWPAKRLLLVAVDAETGRRVTFDAGSGIDLPVAVAASGAVPGIHPLVEIGGKRYADGGCYSQYNADLAAGHDLVIVITPVSRDADLDDDLGTETAALGGATVHVIIADEASRTAIGPNNAQTWPAALEAGVAQAERELGALRPLWVTADK
jgi:NTE family protein